MTPPAAVAHPFDDGTAALLLPLPRRDRRRRSARDARAWRALVRAARARARRRCSTRRSARPSTCPATRSSSRRFGLSALLPARALAAARFRGPRARALFAGLAAHAARPLERVAVTPRSRLVLGAAGHAVGWPFPAGGAARIAGRARWPPPRARRRDRDRRGGARRSPTSPPARAVLLDLGAAPGAPRRRRAAPGALRARASRASATALARSRWTTRSPRRSRGARAECARAGTVHLGGTLEEIAAAERAVAARRAAGAAVRARRAAHALRPVARAAGPPHRLGLLPRAARATPATRPPRSRPSSSGSRPGSASVVLARAVARPAPRSRRDDANLVGGDVGGGRELAPRRRCSARSRAWSPGRRRSRRLPLLGLDPAGRRRPRHVRVPRRARGAAGRVRRAGRGGGESAPRGGGELELAGVHEPPVRQELLGHGDARRRELVALAPAEGTPRSRSSARRAAPLASRCSGGDHTGTSRGRRPWSLRSPSGEPATRRARQVPRPNSDIPGVSRGWRSAGAGSPRTQGGHLERDARPPLPFDRPLTLPLRLRGPRRLAPAVRRTRARAPGSAARGSRRARRAASRTRSGSRAASGASR